MQKKIQSALISVYYKDGLEQLAQTLANNNVVIYSTGGTQKFLEQLGISVIPVESQTGYPSILGGRVKTLHPTVFGGILGRRNNTTDIAEMQEYKIPAMDLVIVDLYPFEETVASTSDESLIIEKIDIGGPSMLRAAAKNHADVVVIANKADYTVLNEMLNNQDGATSLEQRRMFAIKAFDTCTAYDTAISNYFHQSAIVSSFGQPEKIMRYGENPHQQAAFYGDLSAIFNQLHGKELSYNNLVDVDAALQLMADFDDSKIVFAIIKHTNVCGVAARFSILDSWQAALAGDPESAFGGVLITNGVVNLATAEAINEIFFEVLIAKGFDADALQLLQTKKNRILIEQQKPLVVAGVQKNVINGLLVQQADSGNYTEWNEAGGRTSSENEKSDLAFANIICKHLKSNAIALIKNNQLIGKGCGQTSRIDALRQAIDKAGQFQFDLQEAVLASDAFFPFDDCVKMAHEAGITAFIQPGGSIRDKDSINYCVENNLAMVITGMRHFKH